MKDTRTAKEVSKVGTIVHDVFDEGLRFIVVRGPYHWCGYVGIPKDHPLAGFSYNDLPSVSAHGGLTFGEAGSKDSSWDEGYYWYGWDYGHSGDYSHYDHRPERKDLGDKDWTVEEVISDSWGALYDFKILMRLAEKIYKKK